jgi:DNA-binding transcriptional LysR family regulator
MDTIQTMKVFCLVAERRSFVAASEHFDISPTMVTKYIQHLERRLGARLLNRTSHNVSLTEAGARYLDQVRRLLETLGDVEAEVSQATVVPRGLLRLSGPVWLANTQFAQFLTEFSARYPEVRVEVDLSGRFVNLIEDNFDLVLRCTRKLDENLIARTVTNVSFPLVGAPEYFAKHGRPKRVAELSEHTFLAYSIQSLSGLTLITPQGEEEVNCTPAFMSNNETLLHLAALRGMGICFMPMPLIRDDLLSGRLEIVLPDCQIHHAPLFVIYPSRQYLSAKVRTFIDALVESYRQLDASTEH